MKMIYVAGPFRSKSVPYNHYEQEQNIRRAEEIANRIWCMGAVGVCPHSMTRYWQGSAPDQLWLDGDLEILKRCDAIYLCPGWEGSSGTLAEKAQAEQDGQPVFDNLQDLEWWLEDPQTEEAKDKSMQVGDTCKRALSLITRDRNDDYGDVLEDFNRTVKIFYLMTGIELTIPQALKFMQSVKLSREANMHKEDNLEDLAGYTDLLNYAYDALEASNGEESTQCNHKKHQAVLGV